MVYTYQNLGISNSSNGKLRPLGIPAYEDMLVQGVIADVLRQLHEERFLDCSYGFRPGRSAYDVVKYINDTIMFKHVTLNSAS